MTIAAPSLFPFRHDWAEPFQITREWSTDVQQALDGSEVRVQRRDAPSLTVAMRCVFLSEMGAGRLLATWRGATRPLRYYAPLWCDVSDLTAPITATDTTIFADLTDRPLLQQAPSHVMLFRDEAHAEVVSVSAYTTGQLSTSAVVNSYAKAGTRVVPVRPMWLSMPLDVNWMSEKIATAALTFTDQRPQAGIDLDDAVSSAVADSIAIYGAGLNHGTWFIEAVVFDAAGVPIPNAAVTWEAVNLSSGSVSILPSVNSRFAKFVSSSPSYTITATCGSATATVTS